MVATSCREQEEAAATTRGVANMHAELCGYLLGRSREGEIYYLSGPERAYSCGRNDYHLRNASPRVGDVRANDGMLWDCDCKLIAATGSGQSRKHRTRGRRNVCMHREHVHGDVTPRAICRLHLDLWATSHYTESWLYALPFCRLWSTSIP